MHGHFEIDLNGFEVEKKSIKADFAHFLMLHGQPQLESVKNTKLEKIYIIYGLM